MGGLTNRLSARVQNSDGDLHELAKDEHVALIDMLPSIKLPDDSQMISSNGEVPHEYNDDITSKRFELSLEIFKEADAFQIKIVEWPGGREIYSSDAGHNVLDSFGIRPAQTVTTYHNVKLAEQLAKSKAEIIRTLHKKSDQLPSFEHDDFVDMYNRYAQLLLEEK